MAYSGQGTGTENDPYQITTLDQMIECFDVYSNTTKPSSDQPVHVYCKLMNDIDFNNYPDYWQCREHMFYANNREYLAYSDRHHFIQIDGNNHGLYNIYCYNVKNVFHTYCDSSAHQNRILLKNMTLEVLDIFDVNEIGRGNVFNGSAGDSAASYYDSGIFFTNCDLRIKYYPYKCRDHHHLFRMVGFTNCILNIDIIANSDSFSGNSNSRCLILESNSSILSTNNAYNNYYNEWKIRVIMINRTSISSSYELGFFENTTHAFSSFFIEMVAMFDNSQNVYLTAETYTSSFSNCYFVVKNMNTTNKAKFSFQKLIKIGVNFYDASVIDAANIDVSQISGNGELLALTTEQCKSATFLEQQGFIIAT